jgi:hypothetical protein
MYDGHAALPSAVHWANSGLCDDYLISPMINANVASLTLWTDGCSGVYCDAIDVQVLLVIGDAGGGDDILVGSLREVWAAAADPYNWNEGTWDLTPLLPGGSFRVISGTSASGDSIAIDDVDSRDLGGGERLQPGRVPDDCEPNVDGDALPDVCDPCPGDAGNDADGDGFCESDEICDDDPLKQDPGQCGCGTPDSDSDGNGTADCLDSPGTIPTISEWGLVILALLLLTSAKVAFRRSASSGFSAT